MSGDEMSFTNMVSITQPPLLSEFTSSTRVTTKLSSPSKVSSPFHQSPRRGRPPQVNVVIPNVEETLNYIHRGLKSAKKSSNDDVTEGQEELELNLRDVVHKKNVEALKSRIAELELAQESGNLAIAELSRCKKENAALNSKLKEWDSIIVLQKEKIDSFDVQMKAVTDESERIRGVKERADAKIKELRVKIRELDDNNLKLKVENDKLQTKLSDSVANLLNCETRLANARKSMYDDLVAEAGRLVASNISALELAKETLTEENSLLVSKISVLESDNESLKVQIRHSENKTRTLEEELVKLSSVEKTLDQLNSELVEVKRLLQESIQSTSDLRLEKRRLESLVAELTREKQELQESHDRVASTAVEPLQQQLEAAAERERALEARITSLEGSLRAEQSMNAILEASAADRTRSVAAALERGYRTADLEQQLASLRAELLAVGAEAESLRESNRRLARGHADMSLELDLLSSERSKLLEKNGSLAVALAEESRRSGELLAQFEQRLEEAMSGAEARAAAAIGDALAEAAQAKVSEESMRRKLDILRSSATSTSPQSKYGVESTPRASPMRIPPPIPSPSTSTPSNSALPTPTAPSPPSSTVSSTIMASSESHSIRDSLAAPLLPLELGSPRSAFSRVNSESSTVSTRKADEKDILSIPGDLITTKDEFRTPFKESPTIVFPNSSPNNHEILSSQNRSSLSNVLNRHRGIHYGRQGSHPNSSEGKVAHSEQSPIPENVSDNNDPVFNVPHSNQAVSSSNAEKKSSLSALNALKNLRNSAPDWSTLSSAFSNISSSRSMSSR